MPSVSESPYERLSRDQAARVDAVCDDFEVAWRAVATGGKRPDLRTLLAAFQDPERTVLARELIALDRAYRQRRGEDPQPTDYHSLCGNGDGLFEAGDSTPAKRAAGQDQSPDCFPPIPGCEIVSVLGTGGMGIVYKARQPALDRFVAVKMLRGTALDDDDHRQRFLQEARAVAHLQHPNLVQVFEIGETKGVSSPQRVHAGGQKR